MMDQSVKALAIVKEHGLSQFQKCTADELRELLENVNEEMRELQEKMKKVKTERQILEMLLYVMFPEEAKQDSGLGYYHGAAHMISLRLSQIRGDRGAGKTREACCVEGCKLDVLAKGFCKFHYDEETRDKRSAPLKEGAVPQETAKKSSPKTQHGADPKRLSKCCEAATCETDNPGIRICAECWEETPWTLTKAIPKS